MSLLGRAGQAGMVRHWGADVVGCDIRFVRLGHSDRLIPSQTGSCACCVTRACDAAPRLPCAPAPGRFGTVDAAQAADAGHRAGLRRRRERDDAGEGCAPRHGVLPGRAAGAILLRSPRRVAHRPDPAPAGTAQDAAPEVQLSYRVDDIAAAVERVRRPVAARTNPSSSRTGCSPSASTTRGATSPLAASRLTQGRGG